MLPVSQKEYSNSGNHEVLSKVPKTAKYILDIGCGSGANAHIMSRDGKVVDGITISEIEATSARLVCRNVYVHNLENGLPEDIEQIYDCVICSHVLEHICFPETLLADIHNVLRSDGQLIIALPNLLYYKNRFRILFGYFEYRDTGLMDYTHFRWYTFVSAQKMLKDSSYKLVHASVEGSFPLLGIRKILPHSISDLIDTAACNIIPGLFGYQMLYIAVPILERSK